LAGSGQRYGRIDAKTEPLLFAAKTVLQPPVLPTARQYLEIEAMAVCVARACSLGRALVNAGQEPPLFDGEVAVLMHG
jgi:hypothetical protein